MARSCLIDKMMLSGFLIASMEMTVSSVQTGQRRYEKAVAAYSNNVSHFPAYLLIPQYVSNMSEESQINS